MNSAKGTRKGLGVTTNVFSALLCTGVLFLAGQGTCFASTVVLQWDPNTDTDLSGYKVYYQADTAAQPFQGTGSAQGSAPVNVNKQTTATISGLDPAHAYNFAVVAYNTSGVESAYSNIVTVPELVSPTVSLSNPAGNATVSGTVPVSAGASDNVGVTRVEFYVNGVLQATDTSTPYLYSWNTAALSAGSYTLMAKAYDAAGNVGQSANVAVSVVNDNTAPAVSVTAPANNASVSGTISITANASDNVGVSKVEFYGNGSLLSATNVSPYSSSWNTTTVANGSYTLTAKAIDTAGNAGQSSVVTVTVNNSVPDTTVPVVSAFSMPATAASLTVAVSSLTATDSVGVTGYLITESATKPAASAAGWTAAAPTSFTFSAAGSKTAYAWARDGAGNISAARSSSTTITLSDITAPVVTINSPAGGTKVGSRTTIKASASDNRAVTKMELYIDNVLKAKSSSSSLKWTWNTYSYAKGSHVLQVKAFDAANNSSSRSITVTK